MYSYETISDDLTSRLADYLRRFGLHSGVFDLAIRRDGLPVFFECNPNGQWYDTDKALGGRIMDLTAQHISAHAADRRAGARTLLRLAS